jgi:hypothetical protein
MAFTIEDFRDLIDLLAQHPEWRAELRRYVLSEELLDLPAAVQRLADATTVLTSRVDTLAEAQTRSEAALASRLDAVAEAQTRTESTLRDIARWQSRADVRFGYLEGRALESDFERNGPAYLGTIARRLKVIEPGRLVDLLDDAIDEGRLTFEEREAIMRSDVVLSGRRRQDGQEIYLLVEISAGVRTHDVERAVDRAGLLSKLGRPALPVVAGHRINRDAAELARRLGAWTALEGQVTAPPSA